ncbi:MAG TPA: hypothetical protein GXX55_06355 [Firmicutes bacterium]|nr:hypothetical protein [Bacillota bacterium]
MPADDIEMGSTGHEEDLSPLEVDTVREIGSIMMGASSTSLSVLTNRPAQVTVPTAEILTWEELAARYSTPCYVVQIRFEQGMRGTGMLVIDEEGGLKLARLILGEMADEITPDDELSLSTLAEVMNQMMGSAATALATLLQRPVVIRPPRARRVRQEDLLVELRASAGEPASSRATVVGCLVRIGEGIEIGMALVLQPQLARGLVRELWQIQGLVVGEALPETETIAPGTTSALEAGAPTATAPGAGKAGEVMAAISSVAESGEVVAAPVSPAGEPAGETAGQERRGRGSTRRREEAGGKEARAGKKTPHARSRRAATAGRPQARDDDGLGNLSIELIRDVPLEVAVRLGTTELPFEMISRLGPGAMITLQQNVRQPVEVLANGRLIAFGQIVEVDGNYAVRITSLASSAERLAAAAPRTLSKPGPLPIR